MPLRVSYSFTTGLYISLIFLESVTSISPQFGMTCIPNHQTRDRQPRKGFPNSVNLISIYCDAKPSQEFLNQEPWTVTGTEILGPGIQIPFEICLQSRKQIKVRDKRANRRMIVKRTGCGLLTDVPSDTASEDENWCLTRQPSYYASQGSLLLYGPFSKAELRLHIDTQHVRTNHRAKEPRPCDCLSAASPRSQQKHKATIQNDDNARQLTTPPNTRPVKSLTQTPHLLG